MFAFGYVKIVFTFVQIFVVGEFVFQVKKETGNLQDNRINNTEVFFRIFFRLLLVYNFLNKWT